MSSREFQRMRVFREVAEKRMTLVVAAARIGTSYRQAKRLRARFAHGDGKGLIIPASEECASLLAGRTPLPDAIM